MPDPDDNEFILVLHERMAYLELRIKAKEAVQWDTLWDQREHDALARAISELTKP